MAMPYAIVPRELIVSLEADADYTAKQYYLMDIEASTGHAKLVAAAGAAVFGVLLDAPASGVQCRVAYGGIVPCVAGTGGVTALSSSLTSPVVTPLEGGAVDLAAIDWFDQPRVYAATPARVYVLEDRKSTRLNSSH